MAVIVRPMLDDFREFLIERPASEFRRLFESARFRLGLLVADPFRATGVPGRVRLLELTTGAFDAAEVEDLRVVIRLPIRDRELLFEPAVVWLLCPYRVTGCLDIPDVDGGLVVI